MYSGTHRSLLSPQGLWSTCDLENYLQVRNTILYPEHIEDLAKAIVIQVSLGCNKTLISSSLYSILICTYNKLRAMFI